MADEAAFSFYQRQTAEGDLIVLGFAVGDATKNTIDPTTDMPCIFVPTTVFALPGVQEKSREFVQFIANRILVDCGYDIEDFKLRLLKEH